MVYSHCSCSRSFSALRRASRSAGGFAAATAAAGTRRATASRQTKTRMETPKESDFTVEALHHRQQCSVRRIRGQIVTGSLRIHLPHIPGGPTSPICSCHLRADLVQRSQKSLYILDRVCG